MGASGEKEEYMNQLYFYTVPGSSTPSPYYLRFPAMLRDLSRRGILKFRLWTGSHEAPIPVEEDGRGPRNGEGQ